MPFDKIDYQTLVQNPHFFDREIFVSGERMQYPWLLDAGFDLQDGKFEKRAWSCLLKEMLRRVGTSNDFQKKTIQSLENPDNAPNGPFGLDNLTSAIETLEGDSTDWVSIVVGALGVHLKLKRFGRNLGIQCLSPDGNVHEDGTKALTQIADAGRPLTLMPFWHSLRVCVPEHTQRIQQPVPFIHFEQELDSMRRFVPEVAWTLDHFTLAKFVIEQSIDGFSADTRIVEVGKFHGLPIGMRMHIYEREIDDQTGKAWRRGCIDRDASTNTCLTLDTLSAKLAVEYRVESGCQNVMFGKADHEVEYNTRQRLMHEALRALTHGIYARVYERVVENNPLWKKITNES